jgi:hypothetical protein
MLAASIIGALSQRFHDGGSKLYSSIISLEALKKTENSGLRESGRDLNRDLSEYGRVITTVRHVLLLLLLLLLGLSLSSAK